MQGIVADFFEDGHSARTLITDREEISENDVEDPLARTNRGTLHPGQTIDIGSLADLVRRAQIRLDQNWSADQLEQVTITVIAVSGQADRVVGASKSFDADYADDQIHFRARSLLTRQIRPRRARWAFSEVMRDQSEQTARTK